MTQPKRHDDKLTSAAVASPAKRAGKVRVDRAISIGIVAHEISEISAKPVSSSDSPRKAARGRTVRSGLDVAAGVPSAGVLALAAIGSSGRNSGDIEAIVRDAVGDQNYQHWFHRRCRFDVVGDRLVVHVPNPFILNWMVRRFRTVLTKAAQQMLGPSASCQLEVDATLMEAAPEADREPSVPSSGSSNVQAAVVAAAVPESEGALPVTQAVKSMQRRTARTTDAGPEAGGSSNRRRFRGFDSFVAGECNSLAVLAARQVASCPGERYNPLFIYGGTGTGKTHLLEAIYSEVRRGFPSKNVMYLTSEAFTNYFTAALSGRTVPSFRQKFRNVDVLLVDNIEFLDNKRATQEEFLHTIVQVIEHGGQVVISSDRHPRMLTKQREELTTRFLSGLVCRVDAPDHETRRKLLQSLCVGLKATFHDDALDYLLRRCGKSVRELQGALNQLESHFHLTGRKVTAATARELLGGMEDECRRLVRISDVEKTVCEIFGVSVADLRSSSRRRTVAVPRSIAMFLSRRLTKTPYREIGQYFGGRDHSTVVAAERRVAELVAQGGVLELPTSIKCRTVAELVDELERRLVSLAS